jgi:hypothetical protein
MSKSYYFTSPLDKVYFINSTNDDPTNSKIYLDGYSLGYLAQDSFDSSKYVIVNQDRALIAQITNYGSFKIFDTYSNTSSPYYIEISPFVSKFYNIDLGSYNIIFDTNQTKAYKIINPDLDNIYPYIAKFDDETYLSFSKFTTSNNSYAIVLSDDTILAEGSIKDIEIDGYLIETPVTTENYFSLRGAFSGTHDSIVSFNKTLSKSCEFPIERASGSARREFAYNKESNDKLFIISKGEINSPTSCETLSPIFLSILDIRTCNILESNAIYQPSFPSSPFSVAVSNETIAMSLYRSCDLDPGGRVHNPYLLIFDTDLYLKKLYNLSTEDNEYAEISQVQIGDSEVVWTGTTIEGVGLNLLAYNRDYQIVNGGGFSFSQLAFLGKHGQSVSTSVNPLDYHISINAFTGAYWDRDTQFQHSVPHYVGYFEEVLSAYDNTFLSNPITLKTGINSGMLIASLYSFEDLSTIEIIKVPYKFQIDAVLTSPEGDPLDCGRIPGSEYYPECYIVAQNWDKILTTNFDSGGTLFGSSVGSKIFEIKYAQWNYGDITLQWVKAGDSIDFTDMYKYGVRFSAENNGDNSLLRCSSHCSGTGATILVYPEYGEGIALEVQDGIAVVVTTTLPSPTPTHTPIQHSQTPTPTSYPHYTSNAPEPSISPELSSSPVHSNGVSSSPIWSSHAPVISSSDGPSSEPYPSDYCSLIPVPGANPTYMNPCPIFSQFPSIPPIPSPSPAPVSDSGGLIAGLVTSVAACLAFFIFLHYKFRNNTNDFSKSKDAIAKVMSHSGDGYQKATGSELPMPASEEVVNHHAEHTGLIGVSDSSHYGTA